MRAVVIESYGGPEELAICEVPAPEPGPDEVLVDVVASALNRADLLQRMGLYPGPSMEYEVPGLEFAGRVASVGEAVGRWLVGDEVMAITSGGAHAGQAGVHADQAMGRTPAPYPRSSSPPGTRSSSRGACNPEGRRSSMPGPPASVPPRSSSAGRWGPRSS